MPPFLDICELEKNLIFNLQSPIETDKMKATTLMSLLLAATVEAQTVYLIRHGEKPADGGNGLTTQGMQRAQCLRKVFGNESTYDIGYIIAEQPKSSTHLRHFHRFTPKTIDHV